MGKVIYQGKSVEVVRVAKTGDKDFKAGAGEQVLIRLADGTEKTVPKAETTPADQGQSGQPA
jgi:hypothetical protein